MMTTLVFSVIGKDCTRDRENYVYTSLGSPFTVEVQLFTRIQTKSQMSLVV